MINLTTTNIIISDCSDFNLIQYVGKKIEGITAFNEISNVSSGECFFACFNTTGCYTFSYNNVEAHCQLYTCYGAPCVLEDENTFTTYVRECASTVSEGTCSIKRISRIVVIRNSIEKHLPYH